MLKFKSNYIPQCESRRCVEINQKRRERHLLCVRYSELALCVVQDFFSAHTLNGVSPDVVYYYAVDRALGWLAASRICRGKPCASNGQACLRSALHTRVSHWPVRNPSYTAFQPSITTNLPFYHNH